MDEEALQRQLRDILDPLGVEIGGPDGRNAPPQEVRRQHARQSGEVKIVCLYAQEDERYWQRLSAHFTVPGQAQLSWHPCKVSKQREGEAVLKELEQAHIVVVLVSVDLLLALIRSDRRIEKMLVRIAGYQEQAFASFAVLLRPCAWEDYQFAQQSIVLPKNARPLVVWPRQRREVAYMEVVQAIRIVVEG